MRTIHIKLSDCPIRIVIEKANPNELEWQAKLTGLCSAVVTSYRVPREVLLTSSRKGFEVCAARRELCKLAYDRKIPMCAIAEFLSIDVGGVKHYLKETQV